MSAELLGMVEDYITLRKKMGISGEGLAPAILLAAHNICESLNALKKSVERLGANEAILSGGKGVLESHTMIMEGRLEYLAERLAEKLGDIATALEEPPTS